MKRFGLALGGCEANIEALIASHLNEFSHDSYNLIEIGSAGCVTLRAFKDIIQERRTSGFRVIGFDLPNGWSLDWPEIQKAFNEQPYLINDSEVVSKEPHLNGMSLFLLENPRSYLRDRFSIPIDFAFIDGCHGKCAARDFEAIESKVRLGGLVMFHDIGVLDQGHDWQTHCGEFINVRKHVQDLGLLDGTRSGWRFIVEIPGSRVWGGDGNSCAVFQKIPPMTADLSMANLGDALWVTPLVRAYPNLIIRMHSTDKRCKLTAPIFDGLCKVEFVQNPSETLKSSSQKHVTQRILEAYGINGCASIPKIKLTIDEIEWAKEYLKLYYKPIVFINGNSGNQDASNPRAMYVRPSIEHLTALIKYYSSKGFSPLQFAPPTDYYDRDTFEPIDGAICIRDLNVRQKAACYAVIGCYIGGDTGDYHLMLAVGGHCTVMIPPHSDSFGYRHWDLLYGSDCWGEEPSRVIYLLHNDWEKAKEIYL